MVRQCFGIKKINMIFAFEDLTNLSGNMDLDGKSYNTV